MNYLKDERLDALASGYVIGTMQGLARERFIRLMQTYPAVRERVWFWEQMLAPLNERLPLQTPPVHVWNEISRRIGFSAMDSQVAANDETKSPWFVWGGGFATAAVLIIGIFFLMPVTEPVSFKEQVAVFKDGDQPLWLMEVSDGELTVQATSAVATSDEYDYELWIVPADGGSPISLGLVPESGILSQTLAVNTHDMAIKAMAVSRELPGGSVTGSPGEVLYVTELTIL
jgi:anti-sigma-K factor RskA|tara:strand:- start:1917 stop:2606 length:690 start_codon:yes stop_codon:yes gene_type:complete